MVQIIGMAVVSRNTAKAAYVAMWYCDETGMRGGGQWFPKSLMKNLKLGKQFNTKFVDRTERRCEFMCEIPEWLMRDRNQVDLNAPIPQATRP